MGETTMWGICLEDMLFDGVYLHQRAVEYQLDPDNHTANILQPIKDIKISSDRIVTLEKPPAFVYGDLVSPVSHPDMIGTVREIVWHFKNKDYNYYITVNGRKKGKRYYVYDLIERRF